MWKFREDEKTPATPAQPVMPPVATPSAGPSYAAPRVPEAPRTVPPVTAPTANIGKSVTIKGQVSGSEDLYLDGEIEGSIDLDGHKLTIGPNARVHAQLNAREIVISGKVQGNVRAERVELRHTASLTGDIVSQRLVIEDGAYFKGGIDVQKPAPAAQPTTKATAATATASDAQPPKSTTATSAPIPTAPVK